MGRFANKPDGYRYVRSQRQHVKLRGGSVFNKPTTWALYEVRDGKSKRVGTARSEREYRAFLGLGSVNDPTTSEAAT